MKKLENNISSEHYNKVEIISKIINDNIEHGIVNRISQMALEVTLNEVNKIEDLLNLIKKLKLEACVHSGVVNYYLIDAYEKKIYHVGLEPDKIQENNEKRIQIIKKFVLGYIELEEIENISDEIWLIEDVGLETIFKDSQYDFLTVIKQLEEGLITTSMLIFCEGLLHTNIKQVVSDKASEKIVNNSIKWKGNNVELSELIKALIQSGRLDPALTQVEIFERFSSFFDFDIKETQGIKDFSKRSPEDYSSQQPYLTKFLDNLKDSLYLWYENLESKKKFR